MLKAQLKTAKVNGSENMSVISEYPPSMISKAEKNLNNIQNQKVKELDQIKDLLAMRDDEIS